MPPHQTSTVNTQLARQGKENVWQDLHVAIVTTYHPLSCLTNRQQMLHTTSTEAIE